MTTRKVKNIEAKRVSGAIRFGSGVSAWTISDPHCDELREAMHRLRYGEMTRQDAHRVLAAAEAYRHLTSPLYSSASMIRKLRDIRCVVRTHEVEK